MRILLSFILGLVTLIPSTAYAYEVEPMWVDAACKYMPCSGLGGGAAGLSDYVILHIIPVIELGFGVVAIVALFIASVNMVMFAEQDEVVKQSRSTFIYAITGAGIVAFARWLALAFTPLEAGSDLVRTEIVSSALGNVITYFKLLLSILLVVNIVVQGFRLVSSQGEQEQVDKARKRLISGFIGVGFVMLANTVALSINPEIGGSHIAAMEIVGIANYLITIIGGGAVFAIMIAGILLMVSVDESLKDKAKTIIKTAIVALIAVLTAFALVTAFIAL